MYVPFNHPFPLFALVHPFIPTTSACLNNFHDPLFTIYFTSRVWGMSIERRVCSSGETCLDVKPLAHNTAKSLHSFFPPWLCCKVLSDTLHVLIRSVGHLLPLPTTARITRLSSPSTFERCFSKVSHACCRFKHLCAPSKGIIPVILMIAPPRCWVFQQRAILTAWGANKV